VGGLHRPPGPCSPASRSTPPSAGTSGAGVEQTLRRWLLPDTNRRFVKDPTGPDLNERSLYSSISPTQAIPADKSIRFFPTRCRTTLDHSLVVGGAGRQRGGGHPFLAPRKRGPFRLPGKAGAGALQPVRCVELAMMHRSASRCVFATHPTC